VPTADCIDMHVHVGAVSVRALAGRRDGERSSVIRERVERARAVQRSHYAGIPGARSNAHAPGRWLDVHGKADPAARELLASATERLGLTARGYHRVLRVARTIADLNGAPSVGSAHVAEALRDRLTSSEMPTEVSALAAERTEC
jgi:magnesium chelatase family protein